MGVKIGFGKKIGGLYVGASKNIGGGGNKGNGNKGCLFTGICILFFPITLCIWFGMWAYRKTQEQKSIDPASVWYKQTWGIILMLCLFFPVGIYLMFKYSKWNKDVKIAVCCIIGAICFVSIIFSAVYQIVTGETTDSITSSNQYLSSENLSEIISTDSIMSSKYDILSSTNQESSKQNISSNKTSSAAIVKTESNSEKVDSKQTVNAEKHDIKLISISSPVGKNEMATLSIKGKPNTEYSISVYYSTAASKADGLENKTSDSNGNISWTWKVGGRTNSGTHKIVIKEANGDTTFETSFITTE